MHKILSRYATPLTTSLFLVSLISGIALFFHWQGAAFRGMHEWLSMLLIVPFGLHIWKNWRAFLTYFKRPAMAFSLVLGLAGGLAFAWPALTSTQAASGGNPIRAIGAALEKSQLKIVAPVFGHDGASLAAVLTAKGYTVASVDQTLEDIAKASGKGGMDIVGAVAAARK
ncbi:MAG: DUF4405 domain-containing protein [Rhizobiaceae bacterium]